MKKCGKWYNIHLFFEKMCWIVKYKNDFCKQIYRYYLNYLETIKTRMRKFFSKSRINYTSSLNRAEFVKYLWFHLENSMDCIETNSLHKNIKKKGEFTIIHEKRLFHYNFYFILFYVIYKMNSHWNKIPIIASILTWRRSRR